MVKEEKAHGSIKRFGARYGRKPKLKFSKIEEEQRKLHKCPYCSKIAVKRVAAGIWQCRKCNAKFAGKAYSVSKQLFAKEEEAEEPQIVEAEEQTEDIQEEEAQ